MRKSLIVLFIACITIPSFAIAPKAKAKQDNQKEIKALVKEYEDTQGFESMEMGNFLMGLATSAMSAEAKTPEEKMAVKVMKKVKCILMVKIDSTSGIKDRERFNEELLDILSNDELASTDTTKGKTAYTYIHTLKKDGEVESVTEFVVYAPEVGFLSCMWGDFTIDELAVLATKSDEEKDGAKE